VGNFSNNYVQIDNMPTSTTPVQLRELTGRSTFYTSTTDLTKDNVVEVVRYFFNAHQKERRIMKFLYDYDRGIQPILNKKRSDPDKNNNIVVINLPRIIRRLIQSGFLGEQLQYISKSEDAKIKKALAKLKFLYDEEDEAEHNLQIENDLSIVGVAYEFIDKPEKGDNSPLTFTRLSPLNTVVVYSDGIEKKPAFAFTYHSVKDEQQNDIGLKFYVYTPTKTFVYQTGVGYSLENGVSDIAESDNPLGLIQINRYINNIECMGDFEAAIPIFDAINQIYSRRLDNIDDIVDSFLVFINNQIFEPKYDEHGNVIGYDNSRLKAFKENKAIEIESKDKSMPADLKYLVNTLDQEQVQILIDSLIDLAFAVLGAPNAVKSKTKGGGDTGEAVNSREGWRAFEDLLKTKERFFRKSLKQRFKIIKAIYRFNKDFDALNPANIDIKFIRTKSLNTQSNAQALTAISKLGLLPPQQVLALSNLVEDPNAEVQKMMDKIDEFTANGTLTKEQGNIIKTLYYFQNLDPNVLINLMQTPKNNEGSINDENGNKM